jgi:hypothetical protein
MNKKFVYQVGNNKKVKTVDIIYIFWLTVRKLEDDVHWAET